MIFFVCGFYTEYVSGSNSSSSHTLRGTTYFYHIGPYNLSGSRRLPAIRSAGALTAPAEELVDDVGLIVDRRHTEALHIPLEEALHLRDIALLHLAQPAVKQAWLVG